MNQLSQNQKGYEIHRAIFGSGEIAALRNEADRVASAHGSVCVRHLRAHSAIFSALAIDSRLRALVPEDYLPVRSILFDKTANQNWPVAWHQDLTIAVTSVADVPGYSSWSRKEEVPFVQPPVEVLERMVSLRVHLDDATAQNGALLVAPGSHQLGKIPFERIGAIAEHSKVVCECMAGDVLALSPLLLHSSHRSAIADRRRVIHFEYADLQSLDPRLGWHESATRQRVDSVSDQA